MDGETREEFRKKEAEKVARRDRIIDRRQIEVDDLEKNISLIWIMRMRFARRAEVS